MNWKKGFVGVSVILLLLGAFGVYKLNDIQEIKKENQELSNKVKALDSAHKKSEQELKNRESDIEKINKELAKTKKDRDIKKNELVKMKEEKELAASQEITVNNDESEYNNSEQEVNAKYHEGTGMGMTHGEAYEYANGVPYVDEQLSSGHIIKITDEEANENVRKRDEFAASFEAERGRQPTSGEIQSQWAKEQGYD